MCITKDVYAGRFNRLTVTASVLAQTRGLLKHCIKLRNCVISESCRCVNDVKLTHDVYEQLFILDKLKLSRR